MPQLFVENSIPPKNAFSRVKIQKSPPKIRRHAYENFIGTIFLLTPICRTINSHFLKLESMPNWRTLYTTDIL